MIPVFFVSLLVLFSPLRSIPYNCMKFDFDRGKYFDLTPLSNPAITDLKVENFEFSKNGVELKGTTYISVCGRRNPFDRCSSKAYGYFLSSVDGSCQILSVEYQESLDTVWSLEYDKNRDKVIITGDNSNNKLGFDYLVELSCGEEEETRITGKYDKDFKKFIFQVSSMHGCEKVIRNLTMIFHRYRIVLRLTCLLIGLYFSFFGAKMLRFSLRIIGFASFFFMSFLFISSIFFTDQSGAKLAFNIIISCILGCVGAYLITQIERYVNFIVIAALCYTILIFLSFVIVSRVYLFLFVCLICGTSIALALKRPSIQLVISTSFIGTTLVFSSLCLFCFNPEDISYYLFQLKEGKLNKLNFLFIFLLLVDFSLLVFCVFWQISQQKSKTIPTEDYFNRRSEIYRSLNDDGPEPEEPNKV